MRNTFRFYVSALLLVALTACGDQSASQRAAKQEAAQHALKAAAERKMAAVQAFEAAVAERKAGIAGDVAQVLKGDREQIEGIITTLRNDPAKAPQAKGAKL